MSYKRDSRASRASLFDNYSNIEEGRGSSSSRSHEINEHDNDKAVDSLHDRVTFLKRLTGDIHNEVENHNHLLDKMGKSMDASRGTMSRTVDRFKKVFDKKSNRQVRWILHVEIKECLNAWLILYIEGSVSCMLYHGFRVVLRLPSVVFEVLSIWLKQLTVYRRNQLPNAFK
ncbi:hypothetical protein CRG98_039557 [Punica granatum]|uniref:t-SNARE coiled-coil homology domain-containing protein n=1 Tax=Punica granatum TaxID=22663 RepID=A0A2I0I7U3_PUNGR|nr:hypothetical protein CRG98_039557 [Punica granatum]